MKHHKLLKFSFFFLAALSAVYVAGFTYAVAEGKNTEEYRTSYHEGTHYEYLRKPLTSTPKTINMFFWYGSPNSYSVSQKLENWVATEANDLDVRYLPATLNAQWVDGARAFYSLSVLGKIKQVHDPLFQAYNNGEIIDKTTLEQFIVAQGLDPDLFWENFFSAKSTKAIQVFSSLSQNVGLEYIPTVVVSGRYKILTSKYKDWAEVFAVIRHLVERQPARAPKV